MIAALAESAHSYFIGHKRFPDAGTLAADCSSGDLAPSPSHFVKLLTCCGLKEAGNGTESPPGHCCEREREHTHYTAEKFQQLSVLSWHGKHLRWSTAMLPAQLLKVVRTTA